MKKIKVLDDIEKINKIISVGLSPLRPSERISGSEWAEKYYYLSEESSSNAGKWNNYPYQVAILDWMTDDRVTQVNLRKSRRIGYTEMLKIATAYYILVKNRNIAIWQPTDTNAKDFVTDSIDPMIRDLRPLGEKLLCVPGTRSKHNTASKKVFEGSLLDIKGGTSAGNFRRMTKDVAIFDECDAFLPDIGGEGNCFKLGDGRLDDAPYPKSIRGSTPGEEELSLIDPAVKSSDVILYRFIKCTSCGGLFYLKFKDFKFQDASFPCGNCGKIHTYRNYPIMDKHGMWCTENMDIQYDELNKIFKDATGTRVDTPGKIGVIIWCAYSYLRSWSFFRDEWQEAMERAKTGDMTLVKTAVNTLRGETWRTQVESKNPSDIIKMTEDYNTHDSVPNGILVITIGVDVQADRLELEILGHGLDGETWSLDYVVLHGDVIDGDVFDDLDDQYKRRFTRADGVKLRVSSMFIDAGYQTTTIYNYTRLRKRHHVFACMGVNTGTIPNKPTVKGEAKGRALLYTSNADEAKRLIFRRLSITDDGPGRCHFPKEYDKKYFFGLTNAVMYRKIKGGVFKGFGWDKKHKNEPDEQLDCRHYAIAAFNSLTIDLEKLNARLKKR